MAPHRRLLRTLLACTFGMVLLAAVPAAAGTEPAFIAIRGIEYAAPRVGNAHVLDLYLPRRTRGRLPVIVWSAGSAWLGDNGNQGGEVLAQHFTPHGFAVAAVAVRSSSQATFPAQVHDHGTADLLVPHHQSEVLFRALHRACAEVRFTSLEGRGHEHGYLDETAPPFTPRSTRAARGCGRVRTFTGPPVTWDALARQLTRALAGQDRHAA